MLQNVDGFSPIPLVSLCLRGSICLLQVFFPGEGLRKSRVAAVYGRTYPEERSMDDLEHAIPFDAFSEEGVELSERGVGVRIGFCAGIVDHESLALDVFHGYKAPEAAVMAFIAVIAHYE